MIKSMLWILTIIITLLAAYYQRKTGPTHPRKVLVTVNDSVYKLNMVRSIALNDRSEVKLKITDPSVKANLFFKRLGIEEEFQISEFQYKEYPVESFLMNKVFHITKEKGLFAELPPQPAAGKLQYFIEITDSKGTQSLFKDSPIVIRYKGGVPSYILVPHVLIMFVAMLFSTLAGLMAMVKMPLYKQYALWTLILLTAGGMILGPLVQKYAFDELWTGVPFGWDLTDNKTLISYLFWILAVYMNRKKDKPIYTIIAAFILLLVYSIPHSLFGSELDYTSGKVTQGMTMIFF
ncbi:MAG TPA: hypothetical protein VMV47_15460 [Bacteroidales bacterium]|nr:hypothetical protein [Bacteroidales bacterium]